MKFSRLEIEIKICLIATDLHIKRQIGFPITIKKQNRNTLLIEMKLKESVDLNFFPLEGKKLLATKIIAGKEVGTYMS